MLKDFLNSMMRKEAEVDKLQTDLREELLRADYSNPEKVEEIVEAYYRELEAVENEFNFFEGTDFVQNYNQNIDNASNFLKSKLRSTEGINELISGMKIWIQNLEAAIEKSESERFDDCYQVSEKIDGIIHTCLEENLEGEDIVNNLDELLEAFKRLRSQVEEAKQELGKIEEEVPGQNIQVIIGEEERNLKSILQEAQNLEDIIRGLESLKEEKEEVESQLQQYNDLRDTIDYFHELVEEIDELLGQYPKGVFSNDEASFDERMNELEEMMEVHQKLKVLDETHQQNRNTEMTRRKFLAGTAALISIVYGADTMLNIKSIEESGGGTESFFAPDEVGSRHRPSVLKAMDGDPVDVNVIHLRFSDSQPRYQNKKGFENQVQRVFERDLGIYLNVDFKEIDVRTADLLDEPGETFGDNRPVENKQEFRENLIKVIRSSSVSSGIDEKLNSSPSVSETSDLSLALWRRINKFEISREFAEEDLAVVISDFRQEELSLEIGSVNLEYETGIATNAGGGNLALVQDMSLLGINDWRALTRYTVTHEIGHKFSLPHAATTHDVMSYGGVNTLLSFVNSECFSWESKFNWWKYTNSLDR
jgi:hypothetical protein